MALNLTQLAAATRDYWMNRSPIDIAFTENVLLWKLFGKGISDNSYFCKANEIVDGGKMIRTFLEYGEANTDPVCRSYNFFTPDPEIEEPVSPACVEKVQRGNKIILNQVCPDCKWVNRQRPPCDEMFNLLCLDVNEMLPFWINVGGASIKAVKQFISAIGVRRKKLWEFQVEFSLDVRTEPHKHYVLRISPPRKLENGDLSDICDMVMELKEETIERSIKAEEAAAENADSDSEGGSTEATAPAWMDEPEEMKHEQTEVFDADTKKRSSSKKGKK